MHYQYLVAGKPVTLEVDETQVGVRYSEPAPHSARAAFAGQVGTDFSNRFEVPNEKFTVLKNQSNAGPMTVIENAESQALAADSGITRIAPVFRIGKINVLATDRVLIGLKDPAEPIQPLLKGLRTNDVVSRGHGEYTVHLAADIDPLQVASQLAENPKFSYAEPDFVNIGDKRHNAGNANTGQDPRRQKLVNLSDSRSVKFGFAFTTTDTTIQIQSAAVDIHIQSLNDGASIKPRDGEHQLTAGPDTFLGKQYAVAITMADKAWELQQGNPRVRIAILDEGVDTRHEDLKAAVVAAYDAADKDEFQEPNPWDGHGTACAGLAAAVSNNGMGVRGIGAGCSLMAVRIAHSNSPHGKWVTVSEQIAVAIDWCVSNGADVLSNSWGGAESNAIVAAFDRARKNGREGKGCVVIAAAGNDGTNEVLFPAASKGVLAVSASNEFDEFKTSTSRDGEDWWGSCFGPSVSIAAPGVHNYTTDITGADGYNPDGNYYPSFNGTSSATPIVAGAAGLILSANPELTEAEVLKILCESADKIGPFAYKDGRNDQFGFGRLNVFKAIQTAQGVGL
jgi:thermitase